MKIVAAFFSLLGSIIISAVITLIAVFILSFIYMCAALVAGWLFQSWRTSPLEIQDYATYVAWLVFPLSSLFFFWAFYTGDWNWLFRLVLVNRCPHCGRWLSHS